MISDNQLKEVNNIILNDINYIFGEKFSHEYKFFDTLEEAKESICGVIRDWTFNYISPDQVARIIELMCMTNEQKEKFYNLIIQ